MADRPILFSAPMVRALLGGRKTQTRRVLSPQPAEWTAGVIDIKKPTFEEEEGGWGQWETEWSRDTFQSRGEPLREFWVPLRGLRYAVGDLLWVREALDMGFAAGFPICTCTYAADGAPVDLSPAPFWAGDQKRNIVPSIHMPRWASRITLIVEAVRVERLRDISEDDADAECFAGGYPGDALPELFPGHRSQWSHLSIQQCFARLWESINGPGSWAANPWVAAYTFRVVAANIDNLPSPPEPSP